MCMLALCGRPLSSYKCYKHWFCEGNNSSLKYFILPLKYNRHGQLFSKNVYISSSSEIFTKRCKSRMQPNQHEVLKAMSNQRSISSGEHQQTPEVQKFSRKDKLKQAVNDYGATVIIFHVTLSLMSLGLSYLIISRWAFHIRVVLNLYTDYMFINIIFIFVNMSWFDKLWGWDGVWCAVYIRHIQ